MTLPSRITPYILNNAALGTPASDPAGEGPVRRLRVSQFPFLPSRTLASFSVAAWEAAESELACEVAGAAKRRLSRADFFARMAARDERVLRTLLKNGPRKDRILNDARDEFFGARGRGRGRRPKESAAPREFMLAVYRATGTKIPRQSEWRTGNPSVPRADVQTVEKHLHNAFLFTQLVLKDNAILKRIIPQDKLGFFANELNIAVVDLDPSEGKDPNGYPNAANTLGPNGENMMLYGKSPQPGSPASQALNPVYEDGTVTYHEWGHGVVNRLFTLFQGALQYAFHSGAVNESTADLFAVSARQYVEGNGAPLSAVTDGSDYLIGGHFVRDGALRNLLRPGTARAPDHLLGPDEQADNLLKVDFHDVLVYRLLNEDVGGVHVLDSIPNRSAALAILAFKGDSLPMLHIRLGALGLAASNDITEIDFDLLARLEVVAASVLYGPNHAAVMRKTWEEVGIFDASTPSAEEIVKVTLTSTGEDGDEEGDQGSSEHAFA